MEFNPNNNVVKLCLQGMEAEEKGKPEEAGRIFLQAWHEATNDFERFTAAFYVARRQSNAADRLKWLETALQLAIKADSHSAKSALSSLHLSIARCYDALGDRDNAKANHELSISFKDKVFDEGPFYHGTKAELQAGDLLTAGGRSNYKSEVIMNHIYFTALLNGAALAAALAKGQGHDRVYIVAPTGSFENDPNVTDKKFPGNPSRSYRSQAPLRVVGEAKDWVEISPEERQKWHERLKHNKGEIIN